MTEPFYMSDGRDMKPESDEIKIQPGMSGKPWECVNCGSGYAEYVNGCPHCWEAGIRSKVVRLEFVTLSHCHPCEICGTPVDCEDACDGDQQTIVYCNEHEERAGKER